MVTLSDETTMALVENARKGKDAFEQLVKRYQHDVFRIIRVYTNSDSDVEDLAQETWIKVYRSLKSVLLPQNLRQKARSFAKTIGQLKDPRRFSSWLKTIAANTAKNWLASREYKESQATDEMQPQQLWGSAMSRYQQQKLIEEIRDAIDALSPKNQDVVSDFYICGYSAAEISQRLKVPVSTVNSRLKEARKKLREEFESMVA